jgi:hypothetical protein
MAKKKNKGMNEIPQPKPEEKKQSFKILKQFQTSEGTYKIGDTFLHNDKRVINFLRTNKII